jgi:hypothetical protein
MNSRRIAISFINITIFLFVLVFLYAALSKLKNLTAFDHAMRHSPTIGEYATPLSRAIPLAELAIVILLIISKTRFIGLSLASFLMIIFTGYIAYMLTSSSSLPCTCGGILEKMGWTQHLFFNLTLVLLGFASLVLWYKYIIMINRRSRTPGKIVGSIN